MAKKDAYYFSHDCNAQDDPKIMNLIDAYKMEGYGAYWSLIEKLRQDSEYKLPLSIISPLSKRLKIKTDILKSIVTDFELFTYDKNSFWSESLIRRMFAKTEKAKASANARWNNANASERNATEMQSDAIKGNESKGNKRKVFIAPTALEVQNYFIENGYSQQAGVKAFEYYNGAGWKDSRGKQVLNWKQKMQGNWFKPENEMHTPQHTKPFIHV